MRLLNLLKHFVLNLIQTITPRKRRRRTDKRIATNGKQVEIESPLTVAIPASKTAASESTPFVILDSPMEQMNGKIIPKLQHQEFTPDIPKGISKATIVDRSIEPIELLEDDLQLLPDPSLQIMEDHISLPQNKVTNLSTPIDTAHIEKAYTDESAELLKTGETNDIKHLDLESLQTQSKVNAPNEIGINTVLDTQSDTAESPELLSESDFLKTNEGDMETLVDKESYFDDEDFDNDFDDNTFHHREEEIKVYEMENQLPIDNLPGIAKKNRKKSPKHFAHNSYYSIFINQRKLSAPELDEEEVDTFLINLKIENLDVIFSLPPYKLENYLFHAVKRYEFIGELPISNPTFKQLAEYMRRNARRKGKLNPKRIPPVLFLTSMVFCARYSETETRKFWEPYENLVWGLKNEDLAFQQQCRKHFIYCRRDLQQALSLHFNYYTEGDVVRPVYQHAIIPHYLQENFAEWLVNNFEYLLQYPAEKLPIILEKEKTLDYMPRRLQDFIRNENTKETAARLIIQMSNAVNLFHETEQTEAVESVISSSIERALWRAIYKKLIIEQMQLVKIRKFTPKLEWLWNLEKDEVALIVSNIRSDRSEEPDSMLWTEKSVDYLKGEDIFIKIHPGAMKSGDWEVDSIKIPAEGPLDGSILVLSKEFDLDKSKRTQTKHIIFEKDVPQLQRPVIFFRVNPRQNFARRKEKIDSEGTWIIVTSEPFKITNQSGDPVPVHALNVPYLLQEIGFTRAVRCNIQFPITIQIEERTTHIDCASDKLRLDPYLEAAQKISGLSDDVPPVFLSPKVTLRFSINLKNYPLQRTWLSIHQGGEFVQSILLADLKNQNRLKLEGNLCEIDLEPYLSQPGAYSINLLHNLKSLLDESIRFAWLPENVEILGPDRGTCYSPSNPLQVLFEGIPINQIIPFEEEKCKITEEGNGIKVEWKILKNPQCRFAINWEGSNIRFCWDIERVSAWIEGGGDKKQVTEKQEKDVNIQVRGKPNESFTWIIEDTEKQRQTQLNARGEFCGKLFETVLRDMLKANMQAKSKVLIAIRGYTWELFDYLKTPEVKIIAVSYQNSELKILLEQTRIIHGDYSMQVRNMEYPSQPEILKTCKHLENDLAFPADLIPGTYRFEILLNNELLQASSDFMVEETKEIVEAVDIQVENIEEFGSPRHLFRILTAPKQDLLRRSYDGLPVTPAIEQLQIIHSPEEWITDEPWNEGFKRLLPSWAVLRYPLRFTTKEHRKILHVFPEQVAYGGTAGKGYIELKLEQERIRICASWRPSSDPKYSNLWMGVSQNSGIRRYCECDQYDLWPAYQCVNCGTIVASRDGSYLKLPPSIIQQHRHGENKKLKDQFIDTVYDKHIAANISQYKEKFLSHQAYWAKDVVFKDYLQLLLEGKIRPISGDLEQPIDLYSNTDYGCAISELCNNLQGTARTSFVNQILKHTDNFDLIDYYFNEEKVRIPAFNAMGRLAQYLSGPTQLLKIPQYILIFSMALRLKANYPREYSNLLADTGITEDNLLQITHTAAQACPKLLEWAMAWSELFYIHAIS